MGLTILSMILLKDLSHLYEHSSNKFNQKSLEKEMATIKDITYYCLNEEKNKSYSHSLYKAIQLLLAEDPQQRLGFALLYRQLEPHLQRIEEFQPFEVNLETTEEIEKKEQQEDNKGEKDVITLRSRKRKVRVETVETVDKKEKGQQILPVSQAPIV